MTNTQFLVLRGARFFNVEFFEGSSRLSENFLEAGVAVGVDVAVAVAVAVEVAHRFEL